MNTFSNLKIGTRFGVALTTFVALMITVTVVATTSLANLNRTTKHIVEVDWQSAKLAGVAIDNTRGSIARVFQLVQTSDKEQIGKANERLKANIANFNDALQKLGPLLVADNAKQALAKAQASGKAYVDLTEQVLALATKGDTDAANKLAFGATYDALHAFAGDLRAQNELLQASLDAQAKRSDAMYSDNRTLVIGLATGAALLCLVAGYFISRSITRPIRMAIGVAERVAAGDLSSRIEVLSEDETGQLMLALRKMNDGLADIVSQVRNSSDSIATGSTQIALGNTDLSQRTEEQASNLQQTAASMEQITATVRNNADSAREATTLASSASDVAAQGGSVVKHMVDTMQDISASSKKIGDIIGVIDGIAFQTNILALNAAVEAARAGEQGRGFAVVASEVRSLAQRSAEAAKQIKVLIGESVDKVQAGSKLCTDAGKTMEDIVSQVKRVSNLIGEISLASGEQSTGVGQVGHALAQLEQVTQQNAALVEESATAAGSLKDQAQRLADTVARFQIAPA